MTSEMTVMIAVGALVLLLAGYLVGRASGRGADDDRGRLDRLPPTFSGMPTSKPGAPAAPAFRPGPAGLSPEALAPIREAMRAGQKIHAIKLLRDATGLGLAEAKNAVEAMEL